MPDKRLTDSEIVKALECCIKEDCSNCSRDGYVGCLADNMHNALDIINRQKAENEEMRKGYEEVLKGIEQAKVLVTRDVANAKAEAYKEFTKRSVSALQPICCNIDQSHLMSETLYNILKELVGEDK